MNYTIQDYETAMEIMKSYTEYEKNSIYFTTHDEYCNSQISFLSNPSITMENVLEMLLHENAFGNKSQNINELINRIKLDHNL